ncbi:MAG: cupin domain-containing protein [Proteobacteria bacterium]|nr:cupin domain-containing protein [Pseudomonadota bacterium]
MNTYLNRALRAAAVSLAMLMSAGTASADPKGPLMTRDLAGLPGKEAVVLTVEVAPGQASQPHRHDANVFVYVLEGTLIMQVKGGAPVTLHPGDTFYESPTDVHTVSRNASNTEPAKFLVFIVKDKGAPITRPAAPEGAK